MVGRIEKYTLLIVDDEENIRETLKDIFEEMGFLITLAEDGQTALDIIAKVPQDVSLIDIKLPDIDGMSLIKQLKKQNRNGVYIIITGNASLNSAVNAVKEGADGYFTKPVVVEEVLHKIKESLEKKRLEKEHQQKDKKLMESEKKFRGLVNNLSETILKLKQDGTVDYASPQVFELTGQYPTEFIGENIFDYIHPEYIQRVQTNFKDSFSNKRKLISEFKVMNSDGKYRVASVTGVVAIDEHNDQPSSMNLIMRDITKQLAAEEERRKLYRQISKLNVELEEKIEERTKELRESEQKIRDILDNSPAVFYLKDLNGKYQMVNYQFETLFQLKREQIIGKTDDNLLSDEITQLFKEHEAEVIKSEKPIEFEEDIYYVDELLTFLAIKFPLYNREGKLNAIGSISTDITERKWATEAIKESEKRFRTIFNSVIDGMFLIDPRTEKFYLVNKIFIEMLGYPQATLLEHKLSDFIPDERYQAIKTYIKGLPKSHSLSVSEIPVNGKAGMFYGDVGLNFLQLGGDAYIAGVLRDVTEIKKAAEALRKAKLEAEAANQAKSNFLANMSHELRTPLNAIIGFSELFIDLYENSLDKEQKQYLNNILESGDHLLTLINDILDLSKIEAGKMNLDLDDVDIINIIKKSLNMFKDKSQKNDIALHYDIQNSLATICADETKLRQILFNLLSNAIKFTPAGGEVGVTVKKKEKKFYFTVWDTGIGISKEDVRKLFKPFEQLESALSRNYEGTGLGLHYSKILVELHGGEIWVESELNKGSRFKFTIPKDIGENDKNIDSGR